MEPIQPLASYRYNPARVDPARVVAPPYDVIDDAEQNALYERDPHNVVRLILGHVRPDDTPQNNRYTRAAATLDAWRDESVFVHDRPSYYIYRQRFPRFGPHGGPTVERTGFFARVLLSPWGEGGIHPHEKTLAGPKEDRLRLMRATGGNLEPVFGLLADPQARCAQALTGLASAGRPLVDVRDDDGCQHELAAVDDPAALRLLQGALGERPTLYIADGHHRYETALQYRDEVRAAMREAGRTPPPEGELDCDYILMLVVPDSDPGLVIWPTHRVVHGLPDFDLEAFLAKAAKTFTVRPFGGSLDALTVAMAAMPEPAFGFLAPGGKRWLLALDTEGDPMARRRPDADPAWRALDVAVLHTLLMEDLMGIDEGKLLRKENVRYFRYADETADAVDAGADGAQAGFLVRPTTMAQIRAVSDAGAVMPQKSTYFYPKALSGLLFHFFE